jgi:hypothetical protein
MSAVVIAGDTSGSVTLNAPAVAGTTTLTLPTTSGTIVTTTSGAITSGQMPAGSIIQVVQAVQTGQATSSSTTAVTTGLTASITPKFSTSKILVSANVQGIFKNNAAVGNGVILYLYRNGSSISLYANSVGYTSAAATNYIGGNALLYLDSPATTSSTTYAIFFSSTNTQLVTVQNNNDYSTITLMEVAA